MSYGPIAPFDGSQGTQESNSALFSTEYLFGSETAAPPLPAPSLGSSTTAISDSHAQGEAPDEWYQDTSSDQLLPEGPLLTDNGDGRWYQWDGSTPLVCSLPDSKSIRSVWLPNSGYAIAVNTGQTTGNAIYTSEAASEVVPIPAGNGAVTLSSVTGKFAAPISVYVAAIAYPPSRTPVETSNTFAYYPVNSQIVGINTYKAPQATAIKSVRVYNLPPQVSSAGTYSPIELEAYDAAGALLGTFYLTTTVGSASPYTIYSNVPADGFAFGNAASFNIAVTQSLNLGILTLAIELVPSIATN